MTVDRNEAPEGYKAYKFKGKKQYNCCNCAFFRTEDCAYLTVSCVDFKRKDGEPVIFMKRKDHA